MEDKQIIELYWQRSEDAIRETDRAHGQKLHALSFRIVHNNQDAEESVSDTYMEAWNQIPPVRPNFLFAYLAKICRNISCSRLDWLNAAKRKADLVELTSEMELCIPDSRLEQQMEGQEIGRLLSRFLDTLPKESRLIFMRRYWFADSIREIAARYGMGESKVKTQLHRTRNKLRQYLEKEGIAV